MRSYMSRSETEYLRHILDEANYLAEASNAVTWEAFSEDETLKRAFVRSIEVIGEATKNLSGDLRAQNSEVPWRDNHSLQPTASCRRPNALWSYPLGDHRSTK